MTAVARLSAFDRGVLRHLRSRGLDLNRVNSSDRTALTSIIADPLPHRVVARRTDGTHRPALEPPSLLPQVQALLAEGADPNRTYRGATALALAVVSRDKPPELASALFDAGGRVEVNYTVSSTPSAVIDPNSADELASAVRQPIVDDSGILEGMTIGPATWLTLYGRPGIALKTVQREGRIDSADRDLLYFAGASKNWDLVRQVLPFVRSPDAGNRAGLRRS